MATLQIEVPSGASFSYSECCVCLSIICRVPNEILLPLCRHRNSRLFVPAFRYLDTPDNFTYVRTQCCLYSGLPAQMYNALWFYGSPLRKRL